MGIDMGQNILTLETFISGLVIWNIIALFATLLFAFFYNTINKHMMGYGYGGMSGGYGFAFITGLVVLVDLVLLGIWLWKQIKK